MNIKGAAERTKSTLIAAGAGKGNTKENREYTVLVAADKDAALGMAREVELSDTQQRFIERSSAWSDQKPDALGQGFPGQNVGVVNTQRTMNSLGEAAGYGLSVETVHEVGHMLMPGGPTGAPLDHDTGGLMQRSIQKAMNNPTFTPSAIERLRAGASGGFFK